ncbi:unnamed protein product [Prorocentrum cordatum]|uniref:Centrosomal protein of 120 kDa n=1 Tax=Prorocentrum cordatum TaxID=2364126 RepID=A0ABN9QS46_9DINO|nr:unnamed protein product [Polarella glacialis]
MGDAADRVRVLVRVSAAGHAAEALPPPGGVPSARWMAKLAPLLRPADDAPGAFACCLPGTLAEVGAHLWQHQTLWLRLRPSGGATDGAIDRHLAVPLRELLDPSADLSGQQYSSAVEFEEGDAGQELRVSVALELRASGALAGGGSPIPALSLSDVFVLHLQMQQSSSAGHGPPLALSCGGVEQPLQGGCARRTLVLVDRWEEVPEALSDLDAQVQFLGDAVQEGESGGGALDLSALIQAAEGRDAGGAAEVSAAASCCGAPPLASVVFRASVRAQLSPAGPAGAGGCCGGAGSGTASGPRLWRLSLELRSLRLTACSGSVYVTYSYDPLAQSRPFRTSPPVLARRNAMVCLPRAFAAYTLEATREELRARLEEPLHLEVWHRDSYKRDSLIGLGAVALGPVFDEPLQRSERMPSMSASGFRALQRQCPLAGAAPDLPGADAGVLRVLVFLEELGPAAAGAAGGDAVVGVPPLRGAAAAASEEEEEDCGADAPGLGESSLQALRGSPAYSAAYALELWRRAEEERFRKHLADQEAALRRELEESFRQRELARADEFRAAQGEVRKLEARARQQLEELQRREAAVGAEARRAEAARDEAARQATRTIHELEEASRRRATEIRLRIELEECKARGHEDRAAELEGDLGFHRRRAGELERALQERQRRLLADGDGDEEGEGGAPGAAAGVRQQLQQARLELREAEARAEALAASRDHFRQRIEELCAGALVAPLAPQCQLFARARGADADAGLAAARHEEVALTERLASALETVRELEQALEPESELGRRILLIISVLAAKLQGMPILGSVSARRNAAEHVFDSPAGVIAIASNTELNKLQRGGGSGTGECGPLRGMTARAAGRPRVAGAGAGGLAAGADGRRAHPAVVASVETAHEEQEDAEQSGDAALDADKGRDSDVDLLVEEVDWLGLQELEEMHRQIVAFPGRVRCRAEAQPLVNRRNEVNDVNERLEVLEQWSPAPAGAAAAAPVGLWLPAEAGALAPAAAAEEAGACEMTRRPTAEEAAGTEPRAHAAWLRAQRAELLQSGLYSEGDAVVRALDARLSAVGAAG